ncbi:MAG TPA: hypothetical protein VL551_22095 [Actinospica sp.]|jgi:hypothetical protein|nr:hypothetical protein [Actinospica sp.]
MPATLTAPDPIAERFARETADHVMTIAHDDGHHRHLKFRGAKDWAYWFDLITVPGALIFRGDGASFVFARVPDMFEFFRSNPDRATRRINPHYWAEKLTSDRASVKTYSRERLEQLVAEHLEEAEEKFPGVTAAWGFLTEDSSDYDLDYAESARQALNAFEYSKFHFTDTWEWDLNDFDWWYLWACHAIVWGIAQYDQATAAVLASA